MDRPPAGLCTSCSWQRLVRTTRGSVFSLCERHRTDPRYAKYPPIPVAACPGWEPGGREDGRPDAAARGRAG